MYSTHRNKIATLSRRCSFPVNSRYVDADPIAFAHAVGFEPDAWQAQLLQSTSKRIIVNCCRQSGKTTAVALMAIHEALTKPNSLVLAIAPTQRQSGLLFRKIMQFYSDAGRPVAATSETVLQLRLSNGSWIVALPDQEATVRGYTATTILVDEAARVSDELFMGIMPMLAVTNGRLVLTSTPYGKRGFFSETWHTATNWEKIKITAHDCARISPAFLSEQRERMGKFWFESEYLCSFEASESSLFSETAINEMFSEDVEEFAF